MTTLLLVVISLWVASLSLMYIAGMTPTPPGLPIIAFLFSVVPVAHAAAVIAAWLQPHERQTRGERRLRRAVLAGMLLLLSSASPILMTRFPVAVLFAWLVTRIIIFPSIRPALFSIVVILLNFCAVWQLNYVALRGTAGRLLDPVGKTIDLWLLTSLGLSGATYAGMYPLVSSSMFRVLEGAYFFLLTQLVMLLFFLVSRRSQGGADLLRVCIGVVGCYWVGLAIFIIVPMAGPCLFYPESISESLQGTWTYAVMRGSYTEFESVRRLGQPVTGMGYFVAFPSLHVALAAYIQLTWNRLGIGAAVLALNVLVVLATILLGWHYIVDVPAGILLGWAMFKMISPVECRSGWIEPSNSRSAAVFGAALVGAIRRLAVWRVN
jgi:hypothetical protein